VNARLATLDARIEQLQRAVDDLDGRLRSLQERTAGAETRTTPAAAREADRDHVDLARPDTAAVLSLTGRTLMVFGGAYLLRAVTEARWLPPAAGVGVGLVYALVWLWAADRATARSRPLNGAFHGVAALFIGYPLLWEASTRFGWLAAPLSAAAVGLFTMLGLGVAWRRRTQVLAGVTSLSAIVVGVALTAVTGTLVPFTVLAIGLAIATLWMSYDRDWFWLRWPTAVAADVLTLGVVARAVGAHDPVPPQAALLVLLLLCATYLGSFAARTLVRGRAVLPFEIAQTAVVLSLGLGGGLLVSHVAGPNHLALGLASAGVGAGCYAVAFAFVERQQAVRANFYFYTTLALVLTLAGASLLLPTPATGVVVAGLAVVATWLGRDPARLALALHGTTYAVAAAVVSGLWGASVAAMAAAPPPPGTLSAGAWTALAAPVLCLAVTRPVPQRMGVALSRLACAVLLVLGAGGTIIASLAPVVAGVPPSPGVLATLRTTVLATAAVLLAVAARYERGIELGWLLYPVLFIGATKLVMDDFQHSQPATLFVALAVYGAALVAAPRLVPRRKTDGGPPHP
jgi:hypothetical protein